MPARNLMRDPVADLQRVADEALGPPVVERIEKELGRRPLLPLIALGMVGAGVVLIVVLTIIAGTLSDNFGAGGDSELAARTFKPWFRMTLLTGLGVMLAGIVAMLLAISVRIWWVTFTNINYLPVIVDARRQAAGRPARFTTDNATRNGEN